MKSQSHRNIQIDHDRNVGFNKKYTTIAVYVILVILFVTLLLYLFLTPGRLDALLDALQSVFSPILIGLIIAYLLYPLYRFFETRVYITTAARKHQKCRLALYKAKLRYDFVRKKHSDDAAVCEKAAAVLSDAKKALGEASVALDSEVKRKEEERAKRFAARRRPSFIKQSPPKTSHIGRTLSLVTTYLLVLTVVFLFIWILVPPCIESISDLLLLCRQFFISLPRKLNSFKLGRELIDLLDRYELIDDVKSWVMNFSSSLLTRIGEIFGKLPAFLFGIISNLTDMLLGVFFSVYFLSSRDMLFSQIKKLSKAFLPKKAYGGCRRLIRETDRKFGKYIQGKLISSAILGIISFILYGALGIPYYQMITLITTVTNLIPFFGPFIGAIPSAVIILITAPEKLILFIILVLILQQIEGNILEPRILGDSLGLEPVWIMVAIVVMGECFGILGMVLGVPLFAVVFTLISDFCDKRLKKKRQAAQSPTDECI